jgi:hypothetical protein
MIEHANISQTLDTYSPALPNMHPEALEHLDELFWTGLWYRSATMTVRPHHD